MDKRLLIYSAVLLINLLFTPVSNAEPPLAGSNIKLMTDNGSIELEKFRGKTVYLDFWASWCGPCRKSFPWMNDMHKKYADKGLVVLAVNVDRETDAAKQFLEKMPARFNIAYDPQGKLASTLEIKAMPSSYIIRPDGSLYKSHLGFKSKHISEYETAIRGALGLNQIAQKEPE